MKTEAEIKKKIREYKKAARDAGDYSDVYTERDIMLMCADVLKWVLEKGENE